MITYILEFLGNNWKWFAFATIWIGILLLAVQSHFMCGDVERYRNDTNSKSES